MKRNDWLQYAATILSDASVPTARLDALVLLEDALGIDRAKILAEPDELVADAQLKKLDAQIARRAAHEPLAYIRGKTEFYGRVFKINATVLEPRPESEAMIELLKELVLSQQNKYSPASGSAAVQSPAPSLHDTPTQPHELAGMPRQLPKDPQKLRIADVGTGSGALGITAALELPGAQVDLLELDQAALDTAKTNVDFFTLPLRTLQSDLLLQSPQDYDILLCNLPYVPDTHTINAAALHEPRLAIFGGPDGLDIYRQLFSQLKMVDKKPLYILTESLPPQHRNLAHIARQHGYALEKTDDFIQLYGLI